MSILIKGMEMPTNCKDCLFDIDGLCLINWNIEAKYAVTHSCPLIPIPLHGRLIDADAFLTEQRHLYCENCARRKGMKNGKMKFVYDIGDAPCRACGYGDVLDDIEEAPTIIEVEGEE